ncbi:uncharacterized protein [Typha latifolia]|uniref:uncharacterized protein n=1 Tax=Typha latifolia TaxID=4733 RepID=UPI003C2B3BBA
MQDFRSIPGFASRVLGGADGVAADLRRPRGYPPMTASAAGVAPIKCPRCDSTNTKFCYYNNYNLSQPRHFCKSCRRYWTKGGVLRNVPVGGGCRKSKRPSSTSSSSSKPSSAAGEADGKRRRTGEASTSTSSSSFTDPALIAPPTSNPNPVPPFQSPEIFPGSAGSFSTLVASGSSAAALGFGFPDPAPPKAAAEEEAIRTQAIVDQTASVDLGSFHGRSDGGGAITGMDWPGPLDPSLFDLTSAYWNQSNLGDDN